MIMGGFSFWKKQVEMRVNMKNQLEMRVSVKRKAEIIMALVLLMVVYIGSTRMGAFVSGLDKEESYVVVIDPGHGGIDPGKVSSTGIAEKDINLNIALRLQEKLEENGIITIMTRSEDKGLYEEDDSRKKAADMKARCELIENCDCDILVSIHQNSYPSPGVKGAQVFYYEKSIEGNRLAYIIQEQLRRDLDRENGRRARGNESYYILLNVSCPAVIVECGFMSNPSEAALLADENYQERIAQSICEGIITYKNS